MERDMKMRTHHHAIVAGVALLSMCGFAHGDPVAEFYKGKTVLTLLSSPIALGRPFFAPPDVPAGRLAALRTAFMAAMNDPVFLAEAQHLGMDLNALDGMKVAKIVADTVDAPPDAIARAKSMLQLPEGAKAE
jgi:hypothetical protein